MVSMYPQASRRRSSSSRAPRFAVVAWLFTAVNVIIVAVTLRTTSTVLDGVNHFKSDCDSVFPMPRGTRYRTDGAKGTSEGTVTSTPRRRILLGIFAADFPNEILYRNQFRELFGLFPKYNDPRVCSLGDFESSPEDHGYCELVYTFVLGGNPKASTELVDDSRPTLTAKHSLTTPSDRLEDDMTFLNICENMENGKSQTWFYFAQQLIRKYHFDYAAKCDTDSVLNMERFFDFADNHLPPAPYNKGIIAGKPYSKIWWANWNKSPDNYAPDVKRAKEGFLIDRYGVAELQSILHLYALGQFYLFSKDVVDTIVEEAASGNHKTYIETIEDHDITTMAFRSKEPIHFIFLSEVDMQFWHHGVKVKSKEYWEILWKNTKLALARALSLKENAFADGRQVLLTIESTDASECQPIKDPQRLEFIHVPETGGTSLELLAARHNVSWGACHYLKSVYDSQGVQCPHPKNHLPHIDPAFQAVPWHIPIPLLKSPNLFWVHNATFFMVVRNPYDRAVSEFKFQYQRKPLEWRNNVTTMNERVQSMVLEARNKPPTDAREHDGIIPFDGHWIPQSQFYVPGTRVLHFETLDKDFECLMRAYALNWTLPEKPHVSSHGTLTGENLTIETRALLAEVYREDFAKFGYSP